MDKPAVPTAAEARELGELAQSKNLVLYAYQNRRWDSDFLALKRLLAEPVSSDVHLGELIELESQCVSILLHCFCLDIILPVISYDRYRLTVRGGWKGTKLPGAGHVYDLGTHIIDQVVSLFGKPEKVTGFVENLRGLGDPSVDDSVRIYSSSTITFDNHSDNIYSSRSSFVMPPRMHRNIHSPSSCARTYFLHVLHNYAS